MTLANFTVEYERGDAAQRLDDPLVRCHSGKQIVLTDIERNALEDYFRVPGDTRISLAQWNLVVDRNLDAFKRIIAGKFERDDWDVCNAYKQRLRVTLEDMQRSGEEFTIEVLKP